MAQLDEKKVKKLKTGEACGTVASVLCGAAFIYFIVMFSLSWAWNDSFLKIIMWSTAPALLAITIGLSAFCNFKYSKGIEKLINKYVLQVFVENAGLMHPERSSLTFRFEVVGNTVEISVNAYKEKIILDFSAFKKLSALRKMTVLKIISDRLEATFCRLYERGTEYKSVEYCMKSGRIIKLITDGEPDKKIMKNYLKNK